MCVLGKRRVESHAGGGVHTTRAIMCLYENVLTGPCTVRNEGRECSSM